MNKKLLLLPMFLALLSTVLAAGGVIGDVNIFSISQPTSGSYWNDGRQTIDANIHATDVNGNDGTFDLNCYITVSIASNDYNFPVAQNDNNTDWTMRGGSLCTDNNNFNNPAAGNPCSFTFTLDDASGHHTGDGNYVVDMNCYTIDVGGTATGDKNTGVSSSSFYIDNNAPPHPKSFAVEQLSPTSARLHWDYNSSLGDPKHWERFKFYYSTSEFTDCTNATNDSNSTTSSDHTKDITGLTAGSTYYFCATTADAAGNESSTTSRIKALLLQKESVTGAYVPAGDITVKREGTTAAEKVQGFLSKPLLEVGGFSITGGIVLLVLAYYFLVHKKKKKKRE